MAFSLDIVTPDRVVLSEQAVSLVAPGVLGSFGVLTNHAPFMSELKVGEMRFTTEQGKEVQVAVSGGFIQVFENKITVLADSAERGDEIDVDRARRARERARADLQAGSDLVTRARAEEELARAQNRLRIAGG